MRPKEGLVRTIACFEILLRKKCVRDAPVEAPSTDLRRPPLIAQ
jgi:hypothetical protein